MNTVAGLVQTVRTPPAPAPLAPAPSSYAPSVGNVRHAATPERYGEDSGGDRFLLACKLYCAEFPGMTDKQRVSLLMQRMTGRAMDWAAAVWRAEGLPTTSYAEFTRQFWLVFDHPKHGLMGGQWLLNLQQGESPAADYAISFRVLAVVSGWNQPAL